MSETQLLPEEVNQKLQCENDELRAEVDRLNIELKKASREARMSKSFLEKITRTVEAKDALSDALSLANVKQRAYTDMLLESCPNIIILFDYNGSFILSTNVFLTAMGMPNFDFIKNKNFEEVFPRYFPGGNMKEFRAAFNKIIFTAGDETVNFDVWADFSQSGQPRFYSAELRRAKAAKDGDIEITPGILLVMVDLTDFMQEKQRAEAASSAKSDFLATVSHEIRTPMNVIIGMSEMLERTKLGAKQQKYLADIRRSSEALLAIINDILDFSKIEAGKMELIHTSYNLHLMLDHMHSMFRMFCQEKNLEFYYNISDNLPKTVCGDENRLRQVLTNLLSNAVKYTNKGSVTLSARLDDETNTLHFDIADTGIGIQENDKQKLFLPFEQLDLRKNKNIIGTGLGLPISYNLCQLMGGSLKVESVYGEGSVFSASLPYVHADKVIEKNFDDDVRDFTAAAAKILVVDDIDINLDVAEAMLGIFNITPALAVKGSQAIELAGKNRYDIIFMDHMMPEMDGLETTRHIRALGGWNKKVPIIALTANAIEGMDKIFLNSGMNDYLFKPLKISNLNLCLKKWLPSKMITEEDRNND